MLVCDTDECCIEHLTREDSGLDANVEKSVTFNISQFYGVSTFAVIFGTYFAVSVKVDSDECCIFKHLVYNNTLVSVTTLLVSDPCILLVVAKFTSKVKTMVKLVKLWQNYGQQLLPLWWGCCCGSPQIRYQRQT